MTDKEIIQALECCGNMEDGCLHCPLCDVTVPECGMRLCRESLALINRQQAEIEKLNVELVGMRGACNSYKMHYDNAQAEIERLSNSAKQWEDTAKDLLISKEKQQAEIERSKANNKAIMQTIADVHTEAIKEFADLVDRDIEEKLSDSIKEQNPHLYLIHQIVKDRLKEMVGEDNG